MRVLLAGAAGFIGSQVADRLLADGHAVVGVDDLNDAYDPRLKEWRLQRLVGRPRFEAHRADIRDRPALDKILATGPFDAVVNLAARAGVRQSVEDPWTYLATNAVGTLNLLDACRANDIRKFVVASTSSLYGARNPTPFREDADTERPLSPYAASKKAAESMTAAYAHLYGIDAAILRYFTVYGPAGRPDMSVFRFIRWVAEDEPVVLYGDGSQERDFTFVSDVARGTVQALAVRGVETINLGGDRPVALRYVLDTIGQRLGRAPRVVTRPVHRADVAATWADVGKARALLGWAPTVTIEEGIERTVAWYLENRAWARTLDLGVA